MNTHGLKNDDVFDDEVDLEDDDNIKKGVDSDDSDDDDDKNKRQKFLHPLEVKQHLQLLWDKEERLMKALFGEMKVKSSGKKKFVSSSPDMFFLENLAVPPNRFRPESKGSGEASFLHAQTVALTKILNLNEDIQKLFYQKEEVEEMELGAEASDGRKKQQKKKKNDKGKKEPQITVKKEDIEEMSNTLNLLENKLGNKFDPSIANVSKLIGCCIDLQDAINVYLDSSKLSRASDRDASGVRQLLEKKEGLFRMKMMGKRVNYAGRSVISPDGSIETNQIGVPLFMAKKLTFPEPVEYLRKLIINGANQHPGANAIEEENGHKIMLDTRTLQQRIALAKTLLTGDNKNAKTVYRHLRTNDVLLVNRQPTLHKPSFMGHIAKVLPTEQTIRMHYANCSSYNADFDGDEMNLHYVQNHIARAECYNIALNDQQYILPTHGRPIRGLIQDHVIGGLMLTKKDTFLTRGEYLQLVYIATSLITEKNVGMEVPTVLPCILKPQALWSGKQVISTILRTMVKSVYGDQGLELGLNLQSKSKVAASAWGGSGREEGLVIIRNNELLTGILDKSQFGATEFGMIHAFHELYGPTLTGKLLTSIGRLFSKMIGFTCGLDDLQLTSDANSGRTASIETAHQKGVETAAKFVGIETFDDHFRNYTNRKLVKSNPLKEVTLIVLILSWHKEKLINEPQISDDMDSAMRSTTHDCTSKVINICFPEGLEKPFPTNNFSAMVLAGAKGSMVNHSQICCMLGQQELEGRRVPVLPSGKTLPSFLPYDPNPRCGGYITDRFSSGLRPQEFYFHCMAGREGLVDTAVKTSRSGYLQRCLIKHLESLVVNYDLSVRDSDGSIIQFYYGEDALDVTKVKYMDRFQFIAENYDAYDAKLKPEGRAKYLKGKRVRKYMKDVQKKYKDDGQKYFDPVMSKFNPGVYLGAISEKMSLALNKFVEGNSDSFFTEDSKMDPITFKNLYYIKYLGSLIHPGEGVGCLAAQSVGEPSTQMTLNTFHLAGHGGANVTLGVPRLREVIMTASANIKTPSMTIYLNKDKEFSSEEIDTFALGLQKVKLSEICKDIDINEKIVKKPMEDMRYRMYTVDISFEDFSEIEKTFFIDFDHVKRIISGIFKPNLLAVIARFIKKANSEDLHVYSARGESGADATGDNDEEMKGASSLKRRTPKKDGEDIGEAEGYEGENIKKKKKQLATYEDDEKEPAENDDTNMAEEKDAKLKTQDSNVADLIGDKGTKKSQNMKYFEDLEFAEDKSGFTVTVKVDLDQGQLLILEIVEQALNSVLLRSIKGISKCHVVKAKNEVYIQTEGVNFEACWKYPDIIDVNRLSSNDIHAILRTYGVEAARLSIMNEIIRVFSVYGINVDKRHLGLIADFMTHSGGYRAFNRGGMEENPSPFLRMSFESTMNYLTHCSLYHQGDDGNSPSSGIVLGNPVKVGTGVFNIVQEIK
eukprot:CAMPEP_0115014766 /NCGR_PEP_ID=MMETSP0216-20121206/26300_1 /TAXON_ID=223996 /ORGANISM="Protocruzia adherens, Strain Boccale" /LENGTH=1444 /DNA_ID=CAMNT_0002384621 /DNA_START=295 /DNA_END=4630 /DNA_ORIENTATION=-